MCDCFTCRNRDNIDLLYGYYTSEYRFNKTTYEYLEKLGYKCGSLSDKDGIPRLMAILSCDQMGSGCLLSEVEDKFMKKQLGPKLEEFMLEGDGLTF